jgi:hypothetical protein
VHRFGDQVELWILNLNARAQTISTANATVAVALSVPSILDIRGLYRTALPMLELK